MNRGKHLLCDGLDLIVVLSDAFAQIDIRYKGLAEPFASEWAAG